MLETLYNYDWPGNTRQLQNTLYRYLTVGHIDFISPRSSEAFDTCENAEPELTEQRALLHEAVERLEKHLILKTLGQHHWHRRHTAEALGIPRKTLFRKMRTYGLL